MRKVSNVFESGKIQNRGGDHNQVMKDAKESKAQGRCVMSGEMIKYR